MPFLGAEAPPVHTTRLSGHLRPGGRHGSFGIKAIVALPTHLGMSRLPVQLFRLVPRALDSDPGVESSRLIDS